MVAIFIFCINFSVVLELFSIFCVKRWDFVDDVSLFFSKACFWLPRAQYSALYECNCHPRCISKFNFLMHFVRTQTTYTIFLKHYESCFNYKWFNTFSWCNWHISSWNITCKYFKKMMNNILCTSTCMCMCTITRSFYTNWQITLNSLYSVWKQNSFHARRMLTYIL